MESGEGPFNILPPETPESIVLKEIGIVIPVHKTIPKRGQKNQKGYYEYGDRVHNIALRGYCWGRDFSFLVGHIVIYFNRNKAAKVLHLWILHNKAGG